jgi:DNA-binding transcriptional ArsR family regulator
MPETKFTSRSVRIAEDEAKWLSAAATKGGVSQNDLIRLGLHRLRKELGAANRIKPETVLATAKASKYKLAPPRAAAAKPASVAKATSARSGNAEPASASAAERADAKRAGRPRSSASMAAGPARTAARAASGSTKTAVLQALAGGNAMTAGEVASATGLGRASVSTTLSKLASSGEVIKAARGYQVAG